MNMMNQNQFNPVTGDKVYGKYEAVVRNNSDQLRGGRVQVEVPDVLGTQKVWARPCVPYAAQRLGLFFIPPKGALVWVEFLGGDRNQPIWSGCYWRDGETPSLNVDEMVLATPSGTLRFNSQSPQADIRLELKDGTAITIKGKSIAIESGGTGKVNISASSTSINDGALEVK